MNPYLAAVVVVNVSPAHNNGNPLAPGVITALLPDGKVNVRVWYDAPTHHLHPRPDHLTEVTIHDTTDPVAANRQGLYGAFWPNSPLHTEMEKLMAAQDDINAATAAITGLLTDIQAKVADATTQIGTLGTDLTAIQQQIASGQPVDTSALNTAAGSVASVQASLDSMGAALDTAVQNVTAVASPAAVPAEPPAGTGTGTVAAGDSGSAQ